MEVWRPSFSYGIATSYAELPPVCITLRYTEFKPRYIDFSPETTQYNDAMIYGFSGSYNFNNNAWIKLINQYNSATEKFYLYALAGWRFKPPFGNIYFVVTSLSNYFDSKAITQPSKIVGYVKFTYPIGINL